MATKPLDPHAQDNSFAAHPGEGNAERYARQTRNAVVTLAVIVGVLALLTLIGVIVQGAELHALGNAVTSVTGTGY